MVAEAHVAHSAIVLDFSLPSGRPIESGAIASFAGVVVLVILAPAILAAFVPALGVPIVALILAALVVPAFGIVPIGVSGALAVVWITAAAASAPVAPWRGRPVIVPLGFTSFAGAGATV